MLVLPCPEQKWENMWEKDQVSLNTPKMVKLDKLPLMNDWKTKYKFLTQTRELETRRLVYIFWKAKPLQCTMFNDDYAISDQEFTIFKRLRSLCLQLMCFLVNIHLYNTFNVLDTGKRNSKIIVDKNSINSFYSSIISWTLEWVHSHQIMRIKQIIINVIQKKIA